MLPLHVFAASQRGPVDAAAGGGGVTFALDWTASAIDTGGGTTVNYGTLSIGVADTNRIVAVAIGDRNSGGSATVTGVSIGGNAATQAPSAASGGTKIVHADIWYLAVPTGTTATISVTYSASATRSGVDIYRIITTTPAPSTGIGANDSSNTISTGAFTTPAGGAAICIFVQQNPTSGNDITWTNATKDHTDSLIGSFTTVGSAKVSAAGSASVTGAISGATVSDIAISAAAWGP